MSTRWGKLMLSKLRDLERIENFHSENNMASMSSEVEWSSCVKPILAASVVPFSKNDIPELVRSIVKCEHEILHHEEQYASFYSSFTALSAHYLSSSAGQMTKSQMSNATQAGRILLKFFLIKLQKYDEQCCLSQKQLMILIKGLCKGIGFLQRTDVITLTSMMKAAKLPAHIKTQTPGVEKTEEEVKEIKRPRVDPCHAILEQLMTPYHDLTNKKSEGPIELIDKDGDTTISHITDPVQEVKNLFAMKNVASLQQLNAGDILIDMCLELPYLHRYVSRFQDAVAGKGFSVPNSVPDAVSVRSSFQLLTNDVIIVWRVLSLPVLEPLNDERLQKLTIVVMSCLFASVTVAVANSIVGISTSGPQKGVTVTKDDENDNYAVNIVERSLEVFNTVASAIRNSTRAGGHNLQNFYLIGAWTLLTGLQHILYMAPMNMSDKGAKDSGGKARTPEQTPTKGKDGAATGRQTLMKIQQGFGVLSVALGSQALNLMTLLLDDLKTETNQIEDRPSQNAARLDILGQYGAWQRVQRLILNINLNNLLFNLSAISYRKACMLKRIQKNPIDGDAFSVSDSNTYYEDDFNDSEPILGQWFEETLAPHDSNTTANSASQSSNVETTTPNPKSPQRQSETGSLVPEKGEPHGYINLATNIFVFMNVHFLNSESDYMRNYARSSASDQHMIILAGIVRDLDKEIAHTEIGNLSVYFGTVLGNLYDEFSQALAHYTHNILATGLLNDNLQNVLMTQLGVNPSVQEEWPLQVYPRTLAVLAQILLLRQQREKDEVTLKSKCEATCLLIWQKIFHTLQKYIQNPPAGGTYDESDSDLNVEHMQLLLFLFHSLQLMQKKTVLLHCAQTIVTIADTTKTVMKENQLLYLSRLLLVFDYLMRNLYEAPATLIEQVQWNLFNIQNSSNNAETDKDSTHCATKLYFVLKQIEENFAKHVSSDDSQGMKPRFYLLTPSEICNQEIPKLDGLASNFILGNTEGVKHNQLYDSIVKILQVGSQCDMHQRHASNTLSYLGQCAVQYCFSLSWRILTSLPPSVAFFERLTITNTELENPALLVSLIWTAKAAHPTFAGWLKDCLVKQGLTTQKADVLYRSVIKNTNNVRYEVNLAKNVIIKMLSHCSKSQTSGLLPRELLPQLSDIYVLDAVIGKVQIALDDCFTKSSAEIDSTHAKELCQELLQPVLQLIELFMAYIRSNLMYQINESAEPPGSFSQKTLEGYSLVLSLMSTRCTKAAPLVNSVSNLLPNPIKAVLEKWNNAGLSEFPTINAWRNAFANDVIPAETYLSSVQSSHMGTLSSQVNFTTNLSLKHVLNALVKLTSDLITWSPDHLGTSNIIKVLFPLAMDASSESVNELLNPTLEKVLGSIEGDEYQEKMFYHITSFSYALLINYTDKESAVDEKILQEILKFMESMLEKTTGKAAMEKFFTKERYGTSVELINILLSTTKENLSPSYGNKVLKFFNKMFQLGEKNSGDKSLEKLCGSVSKLAKVEMPILQNWLSRMITGTAKLQEEANNLEENRQLLQSLTAYIIKDTSHVGEEVAGVILQALIPMGSQILSPSNDGIGFSELMLVMSTLAGANLNGGHVQLFKAVTGWLELCKNYLSQKNVVEKLENNVASGKHQVMIESTCNLLSYVADVVGALKLMAETKHSQMMSRNGASSPICDNDPHHQDVDSDWAEELDQDEEDTAGEDSDEDSLCSKLCTFTNTQKEFMNQHWYHCHTCKMVDGVGVCTICAKVCHKDHDVTYAKFGSFFCDCGAKEDGSCQALVKRIAPPVVDNANGTGPGPSPFEVESNINQTAIRRRASSPIASDKPGSQEQKKANDESNKHRLQLAKQLEPNQDSVICHISSSKVLSVLLNLLEQLVPVMVKNCQTVSATGTVQRIQSALHALHTHEKSFETTDQLMVPTLGSQEGAFENVRMNYSGDQGQTIRQLISAHMIRRVAMCCLSSMHGKRQHLAVSHEKGKITVLQLSALLKQADSSKRKLTLTRLSSAPVPFTVLSIVGNPCNEDFLAVCGLKDCHVLTFTSSGSVADHLVLHPHLESGNFIIKALWLPGSQTELALITADFVKIYDLSMDALSPQYYFLLPSGKIRDCCFVFSDSQRYLVIMSSAGYVYTQPMTEESTAKHGPFYVTNILEIKHSDLKDTGGQICGGGVSIYYSHTLQMLCFSYSQGKNFIAPMSNMAMELITLFPITFKSTNGNSKTNNQPLCQWSEVANHPGILCSITQTSSNPVVLMIKPDSISVQEIKILPAKAKITDMVAIRHPSSASDHRTTLILLCEDGSLRIYMANVDQTSFWLMPGVLTVPGTNSSSKSVRRKKATKTGKPIKSHLSFPIDFFEHCQSLVDIEFGGNDVLQIYNVQQVKHRLNTSGMYVACTKPAGFTIEINNSDNASVITGIRVLCGSQDIQKAPSYMEIFGRTQQMTLTRSRWFDFPFTREESLVADKKITICFGPSIDASGVTMIDSIKVYGKTKDSFGWPEESDEFLGSSALNTGLGSSLQGSENETVTSLATPVSSLDKLMAGLLEVLDGCFCVAPPPEHKAVIRMSALDMATSLLTLPTSSNVQLQTKALLFALHSTRVAYHNHKDQALLTYVLHNVSAMNSCKSVDELDADTFYRLVVTTRSVAVTRPMNLVRFADHQDATDKSKDNLALEITDLETDESLSISTLKSGQTTQPFIVQLMDVFWKLHKAQPTNLALAPVSQPVGLNHIDVLVNASVDIIHAFTTCDLETVPLASSLYVNMLLSEDVAISFACKQALLRILRPYNRRRRIFVPSPPRCSTPGAMESQDIEIKPTTLSGPIVSTPIEQVRNEVEVHDEPILLPSASPLEALLDVQAAFPPLLDMPPDADDETMVELAIALSLQDQPGPPNNLAGLQGLAVGNQGQSVSSLEGGHYSDTTASAGASDDEGSGVDSTAGEQNVSGRSSAYGDNVPESGTTGARSETSSVGAPSTSLQPEGEGSEVETDQDTNMKLHSLRLALLKSLLKYVPEMKQVGGVRSIPFMQVLLMLFSDLDGDEEKDKTVLVFGLNTLINVLNVNGEEAKNIADRNAQHEVQLVIMRLLSVMMSRTRTTFKTTSESSSFIGTTTATFLYQNDAVEYCIQVLKILLERSKQSHTEDGGLVVAGNLLKQHPPHPPPDMSPFFLRQYVKGHASDVFEAYPQLLTEMVLRLPYQIHKLFEPGPFDSAWYPCLCEYLMTQQTPFVRRQVRKLLLYMCGSKEHYRQLRDLHALESHASAVRTLCERATQVVLTYDSLLNLIELLKACAEIATTRTTNWQRFCMQDDTVLPFLIQVSFHLDEGVAAIILQLLQSATCGSKLTAVQSGPSFPFGTTQQQQPQTTSSPLKLKKERDDAEEELQCMALVQQVHRSIDRNVLVNFVRAFLLESNSTAVRWQAHSLLHGLYCASNVTEQEMLLDLLWKLWPHLPAYGRKAAQFVDLLGYFTLRMPHAEKNMKDYIDKAVSVLKTQNQVLANHPNANMYNALQGLVEFDGYYLESDPCLVCNNPEIPFTSIKLSAIKVDSRFTTTTQIIKLVSSHCIAKITLRIGDLKRTKMVRSINVFYNNRSVQAVVELKNKPSMWHKAKKCHLAAGQTELKIEFPLPIVACNLMIEYADFYENLQASSETLQCPRCSASVPANPGVCANCGENVFQCQKCRSINYDEKDPFLCNACGFCKYAKFDYTLMAKPCCAVDPIENEEDRKKAITSINSLLEKADRVYKQLIANKPSLETLLLRINEHGLDHQLEDNNGNNTTSNSCVNKTIQQLALRYCGDCKASFDELSKIIQKVLASRKELVEYDYQQKELSAQQGPAMSRIQDTPTQKVGFVGHDKHNIATTGRCYGCASSATEHCITLLRAMATNTRMRQILCSQGLIKELVDYNLRRGAVLVRTEVKQLICLLTRDNPVATDELNNLLMTKISSAFKGHVTSPDLSAAVRHEMSLLSITVQKEESCWEQRLRCVVNLFLLGMSSRSPVVMENITLPCLRILQSLIKPQPALSKKNKEKSVENMATVKAGGTEVRVDVHKWLTGDANHSYRSWKQRTPCRGLDLSSHKMKKEDVRAQYLTEKYGIRWRDKTRKDVLHLKLLDSTWLRSVLFNPSSRAARQVACNMVEALCQIPNRKREVLDMLTVYLDDLGEAGENAAEFLALYQNLMKSAHWKYYLAVRGVLPHIGEHITREISELGHLEETTLNSDLSQGYALKMLTELLSSFLEQESIRQHYKSKLVGMVLNGYLSLRKLVVQRTKLIDETQEKLLDLLEDMTTGTETETQAFMSICVETVQKYGLEDFRTPVFIFERLCSIIYPEENDIGEFFLTLEKDPQQEDFLQGRMLGNPYSSTEPGLGPLMRDVKNKICQDCELVALLEDDNGMELLVCNKIISLDLPVKDVYKKVWLTENNEGEAMRVVYRMRGLLGDATEEFIETLDAKSDEEVDSEEVYRMANIMSSCGGLEVMLERLSTINDLSRGRSLLMVLLRLFSYCIKVRSNRRKLLQPVMKAITVKLQTLKTLLVADPDLVQGQPGQPTLTEQLLQVMETILVEASIQSPDKFSDFAETCGSLEDVHYLLQQIGTPAVRQNPGVQERLLRVLPFLTLGSFEKMHALVNYFKPSLNFNRYDFEHTTENELLLESFCVLTNGIERNPNGNQLKDLILREGIIGDALEYIQMHAPPIRSALLIDSDEWKEFISKPALKFVLRMLSGLCTGHEASQVKVSSECIPIMHRLEQVSSDEHVGSLAENLMEALRENQQVAQKIEEVRKQTKAEKKRLAMAMREKQLAGLGMCTNEKGQVTAKSNILKQMDELVEEPGLVCVICREGYKFQPTKVLGIYTFTKRINADDFENKTRKTQAYTTVTHFNVVHIDCHLSAVRLARGRDEWESAALQNANTKCNGLLPLWGPQVPESVFASCLARHNTYIQESIGHRDINYSSTIHDLKLLLLRFAQERSFSDESGGGGPQSNMHLLPYILHMALYVINTTRCAPREEKNLSSFLEMPAEKWVEKCFEAEGPLYWCVMSIVVHSYAKWQQNRIIFLKHLVVLAHVRHVAPQGIAKLTDSEVKEYSVYKPYLMFFFLMDKLYSFAFKVCFV
uniref:UBR-type domain-containing protein n=1 Tax=Strigamia maritima TaxID=126957 RepID=T1IY63_STRMM